MDPQETGRHSLHVHCLRAQYLVSFLHPSPETVKARLDKTATKFLGAALGTAFSRFSSPGSPGIWLIRRLEVDWAVDAAWEPERLARGWAGQIVQTVAATLESSRDGDNVVWFASQAAYLARFLVDLVDCRAWGRWYYGAFAGLRSLPLSAALRTALLDRQSVSLSALGELPPRELARVLQALTLQDTRRVLEGLSAGGPGGDESCTVTAAWEAWDRAGLDDTPGRHLWPAALALYVAVCREEPELSRPRLKEAVLALVCLGRRLAAAPPSQAAALIKALTSHDFPGLYHAAGAEDAGYMAPLLRSPAPWVAEISRSLLSRRDISPEQQRSPAASSPRSTPFGGIFLLLPLLDALLTSCVQLGDEGAGDLDDLALVRLLVLLKCCGQERAPRFFADPVVRDLLHIPPGFDPSILASWPYGLDRDQREHLLLNLSRSHRRNGASGGAEFILAETSTPAGTGAFVLLDCRRGLWVGAGDFQPHQPEGLLRQVAPLLRQTEGEPTVFVSEDHLADLLKPGFPAAEVSSLQGEPFRRLAEENHLLAEIAARLDQLSGEVVHLTLPAAFPLSSPVQWLWSVVAQNLLRTFAWRLPGFAVASLPYLYHNFLEVTATLEDQEDRHLVRLSRPHLAVILNLAGLLRQQYTLTWVDDRPFTLFPEG